MGADLNAAISLALPAGTYVFETAGFLGETGDYEVYAESREPPA